ncbi:MAG: c-type heme family protein [Acetobacteraceae bacterium]
MGLRAKFNLAMVAAFLVGFALAGGVLRYFLIRDARDAVVQQARIMMTAANAVRDYTTREIEPLIGFQNKGKFLRAFVPSFAAQTTFKDVQKKFPDFIYREAALNPTNPDDRATSWQADLIIAFRNDAKLREIVSERNTPTGRALLLARPIRIDDPQCLLCHSTPAAAPASQIARYGSNNGFGWKLHQIIGAQVVSVPLALAMARAQSRLITFMGLLAGVFLVIMAILNVLLHYIVIRPAVRMARIAEAVSLGQGDVEEYEKKGADEIASLSVSFNRMRRSLDSALQLLQR